MVCLYTDHADELADLDVLTNYFPGFDQNFCVVHEPQETATSQIKNPFLSFNIPTEDNQFLQDGNVVPKSEFGDENDFNIEEELLNSGYSDMAVCEPFSDRSSPDYVAPPVHKKARLHSETIDIKSDEYPAPAGTIIKVPKSVVEVIKKETMYMIEGIDVDKTHKYLGGKNNTTHYLPLQVIELNMDLIPKTTKIQYLTCNAQVFGFDKKKKGMVVLSELSCPKPFQFDKRRAKWSVKFDDILIQYASHNYGQRLAIQFQLLEKGTKMLYQFQTKHFQTITKRGLEKEIDREKRKSSKQAPLSVLCLEQVDPPVGATSGGQLVKLLFCGTPLSNIPFETLHVTFGDCEATLIHCSKNNELICETPARRIPGVVDVRVEVIAKGQRTKVSSIAQFNYLDPNHPDTPSLVLNHFFSKLCVE